MPLTVVRLRRWFAFAAIAVVLTVAGFYFYGRMRLRRAVDKIHTNLGIDVQQTSEGFSLSKSQGGRTLFTVRARRATQYKEGGRAELRDVNIVVYGRTGDRFDQIYGSDFQYDPKTGNVTAQGEVHIDLEANSQGGRAPDQELPEELKNPIHLKTSGLVFNQNSGEARTNEVLEFRIPQADGTAVGASYDSKSNILTLASDVRVHTTAGEPADIIASRGVITKDPRRAVLDHVRLTRKGGTLDADQVTVFLRDDNSVDHVVAVGNVRAFRSGTATLATAPRAEFTMAAENAVKSGILSGGVSVESGGERPMQARAGRVLLGFGAKNQIDKVHALDSVSIVQRPASRPDAQPQTLQINAEAMDFLVKDGSSLERAETSGAARVVITDAATAKDPQSTTTITAGRFVAAFADGNRLQSLNGAPQSRIVSVTAGQPDRVSTGRELSAQFGPAGQITEVVQQGDFHYTEGQRAAWADRAQFTATTKLLVLTGSPRVVEAGMTTTADTVHINRQTGDATAQGNVKTTYSDLKAQPNGALLATTDPVHVTAQTMTAQRTAKSAQYTGGARLWQGANIVQAPVIDFDRQARTVVAQGKPGQPVSTVFVQQDRKGRVTPVNVTAARFDYTDAGRKGRFSGGVVIKGADATVTADHVDLFLQARPQGTAVIGPSQLDHIVAEGNVLIEEPNRRAKGEKLVYTAAGEKFVLTGGPPSIFDAEHGTTTGDSLTFFSRDDRVLVEGKASPTVTQTRVAK